MLIGKLKQDKGQDLSVLPFPFLKLRRIAPV